MDDISILNKGGSEKDIQDYSNLNGVDLTKEVINIEEVAVSFIDTFPIKDDYYSVVDACIVFAKSDIVKEYHTKNMYSDKQLVNALDSFGRQVCRELIGHELEMIGEIYKWFEQNKNNELIQYPKY